MRKFEVQKFVQNGQVMYSTVMTAKQLLEETTIAYYDPETGKGYQRALKPKRIKKVANFLKEGGTLPSSIVVNFRGEMDFTPNDGSTNMGILRLPENIKANKLYLVDGQHRGEGIKCAIEDPEFLLTHLSDGFEFPIVITNHKTESEEMNDFRIINVNQKSVPTDLTDRLVVRDLMEKGNLSQLHEKSPKQVKIVKAVKITEQLNKRKDSPWKEKIRQANMRHTANTRISERSFSTSLNDFLKATEIFTIEKSIDVIINYWNAVHEMCPEAAKKPDEYPYLWNTTGVYSLHMVLPTVVLEAGGDLSKDRFIKILKDLEAMRDKFWKKGGKLKGIGGMSGFKKIAEEIKHDLIYE